MSESPLQILCLLQSILTSRRVPCACPAWHSSLTKELSRLWLICSCCHHFERANSVRSLESSVLLTAWTTSHCRQFVGLSSSPSWFASAFDLQRLEAFIRHSDRCDQPPNFCSLVPERRWKTVWCHSLRLRSCLHYLLPLNLKLFSTLQQCNLYGNVHTTSLSPLDDKNYIQRMLYLYCTY